MAAPRPPQPPSGPRTTTLSGERGLPHPDRYADTLRRLVRRGARGRISNLLHKVRPGDLALLMRVLTPAEQLSVFRILRQDFPDAVGDVLTELEPATRVSLLERLTPEKIAGILEQVAVDDAVFLVESLPTELREPVLELVERHDLQDVREHLLAYDEDSAGRIMDTEFFSLSEDTTVQQAIAALREQQDVEMIFYLYVVDEQQRLAGVTSLRQLLLTQPDTLLGDIMQRDVIRVFTSTDQEEVAQLAARYDLLAVPVTDEGDRLVGIITVDDIVDIFKEEATEDFYKMVGTSDDELVHQEKALRVASIRLPWLLINLVGLVFTGILLERFQVTFKEALFLLTFVPAIMGMGGNSGSQTSTITVRGLATGRLAFGDGRIRRFLGQQIKVGALLGLASGLVVAVAAQVLEQNVFYALVVGVSLALAILVASAIGAVIPVAAERFGFDPAVAAGPLVTTFSDVMGILIYFGFAAALMQQLVQ